MGRHATFTGIDDDCTCTGGRKPGHLAKVAPAHWLQLQGGKHHCEASCEAWARLFQSSLSRRKSCAIKCQTLQNPTEMHGMVQGLVLHDVCYEDAGKLRPILHRASLVEMIVPVRCWSDC